MTNEQITLVQVSDADFEWMLDERRPHSTQLRLPPGGVDEPVVLAIVRNMTAELHNAGCYASWMVVADDEVVGLCSYRRPPANGRVEIGYGIAESRRGAGYATRAIAALLEHVVSDRNVRTVAAETAAINIASQRVLEKNGFERTGTCTDPEDGEVITWEVVVDSESSIR